MWDNKLGKSHWREKISFERSAGNIYVHIQDWACMKISLCPCHDRELVYLGTTRQRC